MDMILLDWTRMGKTCCLAAAVIENDQVRIVRPLLVKHRAAPVRNVGWSPFLLDGHQRWEVFELVGLELAVVEPPHVEDVWVRSLRPRRRLAPPEQRRVILQVTQAPRGQPVFGEPVQFTRASAFLPPGKGQRSLATLVVPAEPVRFTVSRREGIGEPEVRVALNVAPLGERLLPVKDHHLLLRAEQAATDLTGMVKALHDAVRQMGPQLAVRLGLSRPFQATPARGPGFCWLMADGFFSFTDPQP